MTDLPIIEPHRNKSQMVCLTYVNLPGWMPKNLSVFIERLRLEQSKISIFIGLLCLISATLYYFEPQLSYVFIALIGTIGAFTFYIALLGCQSIVLDDTHIVFPGNNLPWRWIGLSKVDLVEELDENSQKHIYLIFDFFVAQEKLELSKLSSQHLESLLRSVEDYAPQVNTGHIYEKMDLILSRDSLSILPLAYTDLWELHQRSNQRSTSYRTMAPGQSLLDGKYTVVRQIDSGGLASCYLVDTDEKKKVVLKEAATPEPCSDIMIDKANQMFKREANILARLDHPQIVKIYDHFLENGRHYLALEYIDGINLRSHVLLNSSISESLAISWALQLVKIISYLHLREPPVVHRDISPENILISKDGDLKLIDFGAMHEYIATVTGTIVGKHAYMSLEQIQGKATTKSDIYSLGCTLYFLVTGKEPKPLSEQHPLHESNDISKEFDSLVVRLTARSSEERPDILELEKLLTDLDGTVSNGN